MRQLLDELGRLVLRHGLGRAQVQLERDETLLDAVVQIAFDAPPGRVTGGHHAR
ncbi:hypothetical protein [Streptomyces sp. ActVer]|uniref:hypothetical protein n=1 Tax=Streptomyces sp. ActVer TaxID=3014558 RepID=UPI002F9628B8